jgi:hypothetical protein
LWLRIVFFLLLTVIPQACARRDPAVESLIGSEPQRLSFGPPTDVQHAFVEKMKLCWFSGAHSPLVGYHFEMGEREDSEAGEGYQDVKIFDTGGEAPVFEIQFHKYNENTLIVTRNVSLSSSLLTKVKRDIQLWALAGPDCSS